MKLFEEQNVSLYQVQKDLGLGIQTLYKYARCEKPIEVMSLGLAKKIADYFNMTLEEFYMEVKYYQNKSNLKSK